jgi:acyl transferase domain-containing protein
VLHPLLHRNTSDLGAQRFSSVLTGEEFFLSDHRVEGVRVLPGVAYLEMARAAIEQSTGRLVEDGQRVVLQNVVWVRPLALEGASREVHIEVGLAGEGEGLRFEVYGGAAEEAAQEAAYVQGRAVLRERDGAPMPESVDLSGWVSRCSRSVDVEDCYTMFSESGLSYGAAYRGLEGLQAGLDEEGEPFILAQLTLPGCVSETLGEYVFSGVRRGAEGGGTVIALCAGGDGDPSSVQPADVGADPCARGDGEWRGQEVGYRGL